MPNHALPGSLNGAAYGTMQGRDVLSPESSLILTAYLVLPPPGGFITINIIINIVKYLWLNVSLNVLFTLFNCIYVVGYGQ